MNTLYLGNIYFQLDQSNGYWITTNTAHDITSQVVSMKLRDMRASYPNNRVRAISENGTLLDII
jgi:ribulose bisphosphate carboxylase small subunit